MFSWHHHLFAFAFAEMPPLFYRSLAAPDLLWTHPLVSPSLPPSLTSYFLRWGRAGRSEKLSGGRELPPHLPTSPLQPPGTGGSGPRDAVEEELLFVSEVTTPRCVLQTLRIWAAKLGLRLPRQPLSFVFQDPKGGEKKPAWQPSRLGKSGGTPLVGEAAEGRGNRPPLFTAVLSHLVGRCTPPLPQ